MPKSVNWLGLSAVYAEPEREIISALPVKEQAYIHVLKAFTDGEIAEQVRVAANSGSPTEGNQSPLLLPVYTDPEDIPFGTAEPEKRRKRPIYVLVWSWRRHRVHKTKARANRSMKAWKRWYERQGWKVSSHATGYFAAGPEGERHAVLIHEYDAATHQRLN